MYRSSYDEIFKIYGSNDINLYNITGWIAKYGILCFQGKLDAYRDTLQRGKTLNDDQQAAVSKYDEVIGTLEFARELSGQFNKLAIDEAKDKKKMMNTPISFFCICLLVMPKYWMTNYFAHGRFPEVGQKQ